MEIVPLIYLKKRKIVTDKGELPSFNEMREHVDKDKEIYVLDIDGIEKDKPNLCLYPKISEFYKIWVDAGPRVLGDVIDIVMAGATSITVRKKVWPNLDVSSIKEITESGIYADVDAANQKMPSIESALLHWVDGLVIFNKKDQIENNFKYGSFLKELCAKYKMYAYEPNPKNFSYWETLGVAGLLVDINKIERANKNGI